LALEWKLAIFGQRDLQGQILACLGAVIHSFRRGLERFSRTEKTVDTAES
jgi:hypothetical protein